MLVQCLQTKKPSDGHVSQIEWTGEVVQLAWKPRIFLYKKFLSDAECDHLINKGKKDIMPSEVCAGLLLSTLGNSVSTLL